MTDRKLSNRLEQMMKAYQADEKCPEENTFWDELIVRQAIIESLEQKRPTTNEEIADCAMNAIMVKGIGILLTGESSCTLYYMDV